MQQESARARSPGLHQDPVLPPTPTMSPPEAPSGGHQPSPRHSPAEQSMEEEFQFLHCQGCKAQPKCPKLLPCLHTLCSGCLEEQGLQCPICQAPQPQGADLPALDNVFFESLQRRLSTYQQIVDAQAVCTRCKEPADFWCFECEQLLCAKCFEAHQWFLKHEARPLTELRGQSAREFLDSTRKSNNIFCSNTNHRIPMLTSIYCRGCSKPLCCTCALLDSGHSDLKCDIGTEILQRQEELDSMTQALQEQNDAFSAAHTQMCGAISQLGRERADMEELIRQGVRRVVAHVRAQEQELLEAVNRRYQRDYEKMAGSLGRLDAVLQRIRTGGKLVQRMKHYASDQEVLDMHDFVRQALCRLRQEEPKSLQAAQRTQGFEEFKVHLQDLISRITQGTDAVVSKRASPEAASTPSTPRDSLDAGLLDEAQKVQAQSLELAETQPVAVVQSVPGAHPVPVYAFSIKSPTYRQEVSNTVPLRKRKSCQTQCPSKIIKMESEEVRSASSSPEQPRPSTSKAVSPPHLDGSPNPESLTTGKEVPLPDSNHVTDDAGEADEHIVVISSSEDSDAENLCTESPETAEPQSSPAHTLPRACGAAHPCPASSPPSGTSSPPAWPPHQPAEQAAAPDAEAPGQPAEHQEHTAVRRGISVHLCRAQRATRLPRALHMPCRFIHPPTQTWPPSVAQAATPATTGPPSHPASAPQCPAHPPRVLSQPGHICRALRSRGRIVRAPSHIAQWLKNVFALPLPCVDSQGNASHTSTVPLGPAPQALGMGVPPRGASRPPMENPQVQVPLGVSPVAFPPPCPPTRPPAQATLRPTSESPEDLPPP